MIILHFLLGLMYIVPVMKGCSSLDDNIINLNGIENEIIYIDIQELFNSKQEYQFELEKEEKLPNIKIINIIELVTELQLDLQSDPILIKFDNKLNQYIENNILIIDENNKFIEYSLSKNQITKLNMPEQDQTLDLQDVVQLIYQDKKYLIMDFSLNFQTHLFLYEETLNEYKNIQNYSKEFCQNNIQTQLLGSGNILYRLNHYQIDIYDIDQNENKKLKLIGQIKQNYIQNYNSQQNIKSFQLHQNSISFINSNVLVITKLEDINYNNLKQQYVFFKQELQAYDYYEPLNQYVVIIGDELQFNNFKLTLNFQVFQFGINVYLTKNYILLVLGPNIEIYSKQLILLDSIFNEEEFLIEVLPELDKFILINKNSAKQFQLINSPKIKISKQNQDVDFVLKYISEEKQCEFDIQFSIKTLNYDDLFLQLEETNLVPSTQWNIDTCDQKNNFISIIEERNKLKKNKLIRELPSLSQKQYILLEDENNEFTLIIQQSQKQEQYNFKLDIENFQKIDYQLWWVLDDEVYLGFYIDETCYIFKLDYGINDLMYHKEIKVSNKILKIVSSGNLIYILFELSANFNVVSYSSVSEKQLELKRIQLPTIRDIFASPLQQDCLIIKQDRLLVIYHILNTPVKVFEETIKPLQTNVIIFQNYIVVLMKSSDEQEKIFDIYLFRSVYSIEKLGRNSLQQFSQIQIEDVLVSTNNSILYLKCQVTLQKIKKYALVGFKIGKSIYKSLLFILLRNKNYQYQAISQLLIKQNENQFMSIFQLSDSNICLLNEDNEKITDYETVKDINLVGDDDNQEQILDNGDKNDQDNNKDNNEDKDNKSDDDDTIDLDDSNFPIGSFIVMSTIEEALIYSLFKTFGRRRLESIDVV